MSANAKTFKMTLTGGATYDKIDLPGFITAISFKSTSNQELKLKMGDSMQEFTVPAGSYYEKENINGRPIIKVNGTGDIDGEYWY